MKKSLFFGLLILFLIINGSISYAENTQEQIERQRLITVDQINKEHGGTCYFATMTTFPSAHPSDAVSGTASRYRDDLFDIYIWRSDGDVWIEIDPIVGQPFICSSSFLIIQNGIQYDTIKVENQGGQSQCSDLFVPSIYRLTQWSFYSNMLNMNQSFTLIFKGFSNNYSFNIPAEESQPQCRLDNLFGCTTQTDCQNAGGFWYDNLCNETPQAQCQSNNLSACVTQTDCQNAGGFWYDLTCNASPQPVPTPDNHNAAPSHALPVVIFPISVTPSNNTVQVGACDDVMIQPTLSVPSADFDRTATLIMYIYIPDAGFGMNVPSKTKILTSETKFDLLSHAIDFSDSAGLNFTIYYGYVIGSTIKYNAYSIVVGASCDNDIPNCGSMSNMSSCNGTDGCKWQEFPAPECVLKCSQFTSQSECQNAFGGACEWSATSFGDICVQK